MFEEAKQVCEPTELTQIGESMMNRKEELMKQQSATEGESEGDRTGDPNRRRRGWHLSHIWGHLLFSEGLTKHLMEKHRDEGLALRGKNDS